MAALPSLRAMPAAARAVVVPLGPTPTFGAAGTVNGGNSTTFTPAYPAGITAGQLLIYQILRSGNLDDFSIPPPGFTEIYDDQFNVGGVNEVRQWVLYRYAVGDETGTVTATFAGASNGQSSMFRVVNPHPTTPFESAALVTGTDDPITGPTLTPAGANRLGVACIAAGDNANAQTVFAGATGGTWIGRYAHLQAAGADSAMFLNTVDLSAGTAISGGAFSPAVVSTADWLVRGFCIRPAGAP
jgi:hypothetical protein